MSLDDVRTESESDGSDWADHVQAPARPVQWKLLVFALALLAMGGGKIFYDRQVWQQAMRPERAISPFGSRLVGPISDGFRPRQVVPGPYEPIVDAPTISAKEADEKLGGAELVLGIVVGEEARAYPINMLTGPSREIINDTLGGRAIAATW